MKKLTFLYIIVFAFLVTSCTENMDIQLDSTYTRLIVDASISTDTTTHIVKLSKTASYFDSSEPLAVTGAVITISDGTSTFPLTENLSMPGVYQTAANVYGVVGKTYNLTIKNVDVNNDGVMEEYNASSKINPVSKVDSIQAIYKGMDPKRMSYQIMLFAQDPPTTDYYMFEIYKNGVLQTDTLNEVRFSDDVLFNGNYMYGLPVGSLRDRKPGEQAFPGDIVTVEMRSITKEYYNFLVGVLYAVSPSIPLFSGPPANVKGNINNGAFGFFAAYSSSRASCVIK